MDAASDPPTEEDTAAFLGRAYEFVLAVDAVIANETGAWTKEFRTSLEAAEQSFGRADRQRP